MMYTISTELLYWGIGLVIAYQLCATIRVLVSVSYSRRQKLMQLTLVWLVPFIGALLCHIFLSSDTRVAREKDGAFIPDGGVNPQGIGSDGPHV
jgi:hypothetical protein